MVWGPEATKLTIKLHRQGLSEAAAVAQVKRLFQCDDKTIRRCYAGIDLVREGATGNEDLAEIKAGSLGRDSIAAAERFERHGGTARYLRELRRAYETQENLPLAGLQQPKQTHFDDLLEFGLRLRERLTLIPVGDLADPPSRLKAVWHGFSRDERIADMVGDPREQNRHQDNWGDTAGPRHRHPLFRALRSHLEDSRCWKALDLFEQAYALQAVAESGLRRRVRALAERDSYLSADTAEADRLLRSLQRRALWVVPNQDIDASAREVEQVIFSMFFDTAYDDSYLPPPRYQAELDELELRPHRWVDDRLRRLVKQVDAAPEACEALRCWRKRMEYIAFLGRDWFLAVGDEITLPAQITAGICEYCPM